MDRHPVGPQQVTSFGAIIMFGYNNDLLFPEKCTMKDHISNTKLEKGDHYYIQTRHKDLSFDYNLILGKL